MPTSKPISIQVSDIVQWVSRDEMVINDTFQRHSVWTPLAKTYLIDTILSELPIPKIYLRTRIDPRTQSSIRELVDGQQRIRAICEFASNDLRLSSRSKNFSGKRYSDLNEEEQERFLGYTLTAEQLLNASDDDVIDIFARLNSYTVALNAAELRHAAFQTDFKFAVRDACTDWRPFIERFKVFTTKQRFRMADDTFFAEVFGVILEGVRDGGESNIRKLYIRQNDDVFTDQVHRRARKRLDAAFRFLNDDVADGISGNFNRHYHLLMILAAYLHNTVGIPNGDLDKMPEQKPLAAQNVIIRRLAALEDSLEAEKPIAKHKAFVTASSSSTQRIASRKIRFREMCEVLGR